jgi:hypothetical protein
VVVRKRQRKAGLKLSQAKREMKRKAKLCTSCVHNGYKSLNNKNILKIKIKHE